MEILKEQKRVYLKRRQMELVQLKQSLAEESFELAQIVGHRLKGHGETFGFPHISSIGISMEKAAQERNVEKLKEMIQSLDESIQENLKLVEEDQLYKG